MVHAKGKSRRRLVRRAARWLGLALGMLVVAVVGLWIYLRVFGVPEVVREVVYESLKAHGVVIESRELHLRGLNRLTARDVSLKTLAGDRGPLGEARQVTIELDGSALRIFKVGLKSIRIEGAEVRWMVTETNKPARTLMLHEVSVDARLLGDEDCELGNLSAQYRGLQIRVNGSLRHAGSLFRKPPDRPRRRLFPSNELLTRLYRTAELLDRFEWAPGATLIISAQGDMIAPEAASGNLVLTAVTLKSPWAAGTDVLLVCRMIPPGSDGGGTIAEIRCEARSVASASGILDQGVLTGTVEFDLAQWLVSRGDLRLRCRSVETPVGNFKQPELTGAIIRPSAGTGGAGLVVEAGARAEELDADWGSVAGFKWEGRVEASPPEWTPALVSSKASADRVQTRWGRAERASAEVAARNPSTNFVAGWSAAERRWVSPMTPERLPEWMRPVQATWKLEMGSWTSKAVSGGEAFLSGTWQWPKLVIDRLDAELYGGKFGARLELDAATRQLGMEVKSTLDFLLAAPSLSTNGQRWLSQYAWHQPPRAEGRIDYEAPAWEDLLGLLRRESAKDPAVRGDVKRRLSQGLRASGHFEVGEGAFRGVPFLAGKSDVAYAREVWTLPNLSVERPEGSVRLVHWSDEATHDYYFKVDGSIDPQALRPMFRSPGQQKGFDFFAFTGPPEIHGEVWGRWREPDRLGLAASVVATNFAFRGEYLERVTGHVAFTNRTFRAEGVDLTRPEGAATVGLALFDAETKSLFFTNVLSTLDPMAVARAIGPNTARSIDDYTFGRPPRIELHGVVDTDQRRENHDLHFKVDGGPFQWKFYQFPQIQARLDWMGKRLELFDVEGDFYGGRVNGEARFNFERLGATEFSFNVWGTNVHWAGLIQDATSRTNRLEGRLSGQLAITSAIASDRRSWQGYGHGRLDDGMIWDIPIFGIFSPVLNKLVPGLGNSRAKEGTGTFLITNSVVSTQDLEIRATAMRMRYEGTVDFDGRIFGEMQAVLLRDMPGLGYLLSTAFWPVTKLLSYRLEGTLSNPHAEPLYLVSKLLMMPFHPFRTLRDLFGGSPPENGAQAPRSPPPSRPKKPD